MSSARPVSVVESAPSTRLPKLFVWSQPAAFVPAFTVPQNSTTVVGRPPRETSVPLGQAEVVVTLVAPTPLSIKGNDGSVYAVFNPYLALR